MKKSAKVIIERYYPKLTLDFETNKRICDEIAIIASKRLRNKVGIDPITSYFSFPSVGVHILILEIDRRLHYTFDEADSTGTGSRHFLQATRRRAGAEGSICARNIGIRFCKPGRQLRTVGCGLGNKGHAEESRGNASFANCLDIYLHFILL